MSLKPSGLTVWGLFLFEGLLPWAIHGSSAQIDASVLGPGLAGDLPALAVRNAAVMGQLDVVDQDCACLLFDASAGYVVDGVANEDSRYLEIEEDVVLKGLDRLGHVAFALVFSGNPKASIVGEVFADAVFDEAHGFIDPEGDDGPAH